MQKNIKNWWIKNNSKFKYLFFVYFIILTWLLLRKAGGKEYVEILGINLGLIYNDKVAHLCTFSLLSFLMVISFIKVKPIKIIIISTIYGFLIEVLQKYMNLGRTFEYSDILADFTGAVLGSIIAIFFIKKIQLKPDLS